MYSSDLLISNEGRVLIIRESLALRQDLMADGGLIDTVLDFVKIAETNFLIITPTQFTEGSLMDDYQLEIQYEGITRKDTIGVICTDFKGRNGHFVAFRINREEMILYNSTEGSEYPEIKFLGKLRKIIYGVDTLKFPPFFAHDAKQVGYRDCGFFALYFVLSIVANGGQFKFPPIDVLKVKQRIILFGDALPDKPTNGQIITHTKNFLDGFKKNKKLLVKDFLLTDPIPAKREVKQQAKARAQEVFITPEVPKKTTGAQPKPKPVAQPRDRPGPWISCNPNQQFTKLFIRFEDFQTMRGRAASLIEASKQQTYSEDLLQFMTSYITIPHQGITFTSANMLGSFIHGRPQPAVLMRLKEQFVTLTFTVNLNGFYQPVCFSPNGLFTMKAVQRADSQAKIEEVYRGYRGPNIVKNITGPKCKDRDSGPYTMMAAILMRFAPDKFLQNQLKFVITTSEFRVSFTDLLQSLIQAKDFQAANRLICGFILEVMGPHTPGIFGGMDSSSSEPQSPHPAAQRAVSEGTVSQSLSGLVSEGTVSESFSLASQTVPQQPLLDSGTVSESLSLASQTDPQQPLLDSGTVSESFSIASPFFPESKPAEPLAEPLPSISRVIELMAPPNAVMPMIKPPKPVSIPPVLSDKTDSESDLDLDSDVRSSLKDLAPEEIPDGLDIFVRDTSYVPSSRETFPPEPIDTYSVYEYSRPTQKENTYQEQVEQSMVSDPTYQPKRLIKNSLPQDSRRVYKYNVTGNQHQQMTGIPNAQKILNQDFRIIKQNHIVGMKSILDVGCGYGIQIKKYEPLFERISLVEANQEFLTEAKKLAGDKLGDVFPVMIQDLPQNFGKHDMVILYWVMQYLNEIEHREFLGKLRGALNDNAVVILKENAIPAGEQYALVSESNGIDRSHDYWVGLFKSQGFKIDSFQLFNKKSEMDLNPIKYFSFTLDKDFTSENLTATDQSVQSDVDMEAEDSPHQLDEPMEDEPMEDKLRQDQEEGKTGPTGERQDPPSSPQQPPPPSPNPQGKRPDRPDEQMPQAPEEPQADNAEVVGQRIPIPITRFIKHKITPLQSQYANQLAPPRMDTPVGVSRTDKLLYESFDVQTARSMADFFNSFQAQIFELAPGARFQNIPLTTQMNLCTVEFENFLAFPIFFQNHCVLGIIETQIGQDNQLFCPVFRVIDTHAQPPPRHTEYYKNYMRAFSHYRQVVPVENIEVQYRVDNLQELHCKEYTALLMCLVAPGIVQDARRANDVFYNNQIGKSIIARGAVTLTLPDQFSKATRSGDKYPALRYAIVLLLLEDKEGQTLNLTEGFQQPITIPQQEVQENVMDVDPQAIEIIDTRTQHRFAQAPQVQQEDNDLAEFEIDDRVTRFTQNDLGAIASLITRFVSQNREQIQRNPDHLYWRVKVAAGGYRLIKFMILIKAKQLKMSRAKLYAYVMNSLAEMIESYVQHYDGVDRDSCVIYFNINKPQYRSQAEIDRKNAFILQIRQQISAARTRLNRGSQILTRAFAYSNKWYSMVCKAAGVNSSDWSAIFNQKTGLADPFFLQDNQLPVFQLLTEADSVCDQDKLMDTICLLQIAHAVIFDAQVSSQMDQEDRAFVEQMLDKLLVLNKVRADIIAGTETQFDQSLGDDFMATNSAEVLRLGDEQNFKRLHQIFACNVYKLTDKGDLDVDLYTSLRMASNSGDIQNLTMHLNATLRSIGANRTVHQISITEMAGCISITRTQGYKKHLDSSFDDQKSYNNVINKVFQRTGANSGKVNIYLILTFRSHAFVIDQTQIIAVLSHIYQQSLKIQARKPYLQETPLSNYLFNPEGVIKMKQLETQKDRDRKGSKTLKQHIDQLLANTQREINGVSRFLIDSKAYLTFSVKEILLEQIKAYQKHQLEAELCRQAISSQEPQDITCNNLWTKAIFQYFQADQNLTVNLPTGPIPFYEMIKIQRRMKFAQTSLLAIDIETYTLDNVVGEGNQFPYVICVYGTYRSLNDPYGLQLRKADVRFTGQDCVHDLIQWMTDNGLILQPSNQKQAKTLLTHNIVQGNNVSFNTFVAHNGNRFDYKFLISALSEVTFVQPLGSANSFKSLKTPELLFIDSAQIIRQSLATMSASLDANIKTRLQRDNCPSIYEKFISDMYWEEQKIVKEKNQDVIDFSFENYKECLKSNPAKLESIYEYCRLDCTSLFFSMYVYLESIYVRPVARVYTVDGVDHKSMVFSRQVFHITAASMTLNQFLTCYNNISCRPNKEAMGIERSSYSGGMTLVYKTLGGWGFSIDINSCYPAGQSNNMPIIHLGVEDTDDQYMSSGYMNPDAHQEYVDKKTISRVNADIDISSGVHSSFKYMGQICTIKATSLYQIKFKVNRDKCGMSALLTRSLQDDMILEPTAFGKEPAYNKKFQDRDGTWQWGIHILYMLKMEFLESLHVVSMIRYQAEPLFRNFINDLYTTRLEAKSKKDVVLTQLCKSLMNEAYGKFAQIAMPLIATGDSQEMLQMLDELEVYNPEEVSHIPQQKDILRRTQPIIFDEGCLLHNARQDYTFDNKEVSEKIAPHKKPKIVKQVHQVIVSPGEQQQLQGIGSMVRISSYVASLGRLQFVQGFNAINSLNTPEFKSKVRVCYGDTDSLYVCVKDRIKEEIYTRNDPKEVQDLLLLESMENNERFNDPNISAYAATLLKELVLNSDVYKRVTELEIFDPTCFEEFRPVLMLNDQCLGRFKIEHLILKQTFTAAKQYTIAQVELGDGNRGFTNHIKLLHKGKGVTKGAMAEKPLAHSEQQTSYHFIMKNISIQAAEKFQDFILNKYEEYYSGKTSMESICVEFNKKVTNYVDDHLNKNPQTLAEVLECGRQIVQLFVNCGSFQSTGCYITVRRVMKVVGPSTYKRQLDHKSTLNGNCVDTTPYDSLYHFEILRQIQTVVMHKMRQLVMQTQEFKQEQQRFIQENMNSIATYSAQIQLEIMVQRLSNRVAKQVECPLKGRNSKKRDITLMQLAVEITNVFRLGFVANSPLSVDYISLQSSATILEAMKIIKEPMSQEAETTIRVMMETFQLTDSFSQKISKLTRSDILAVFFLMQYAFVFNVNESLINDLNYFYQKIVSKYSSSQNQNKVVEKFQTVMIKNREEVLGYFQSFTNKAHQILNQTLLHRNHYGELVACNVKILIMQMLLQLQKVKFQQPEWSVMLRQQQIKHPQVFMAQAQVTIQGHVLAVIKQIKQTNSTVFQPDVEDGNTMKNPDMDFNKIILNSNMELDQLDSQKFSEMKENAYKIHKRMLVNKQEQESFVKRQRKIIDKHETDHNYQIRQNDQDDQIADQILEDAAEKMQAPNIIGNQESDEDSLE